MSLLKVEGQQLQGLNLSDVELAALAEYEARQNNESIGALAEESAEPSIDSKTTRRVFVKRLGTDLLTRRPHKHSAEEKFVEHSGKPNKAQLKAPSPAKYRFQGMVEDFFDESYEAPAAAGRASSACWGIPGGQDVAGTFFPLAEVAVIKKPTVTPSNIKILEAMGVVEKVAGSLRFDASRAGLDMVYFSQVTSGPFIPADATTFQYGQKVSEPGISGVLSEEGAFRSVFERLKRQGL